jgi:hypothetical protein
MHILVNKNKKNRKKSFPVLFDSFEAKQYPKSLSKINFQSKTVKSFNEIMQKKKKKFFFFSFFLVKYANK